VLLPLLRWRGEWPALRAHWKPIAVVGVGNSALPFLAFSYAALTIDAGLSSIFNAAAPLFGALIARLWLGDRLGASRVLGLVIGFAGVAGLAWAKARPQPGSEGAATALAVAACIAATAAYGFSANFTKRFLTGVPPMVVAAGSQLAATLALALPAWWLWPVVTPPPPAWAGVAILAVACTGLAYLLYFRLIAHVGPANAITVTFLIPAFAVGWGALFLDEEVTPAMVLGCAVILAGTALATGLLAPGPRRARAG
jgi:drug/metabolite transporter (DMT)-like permease